MTTLVLLLCALLGVVVLALTHSLTPSVAMAMVAVAGLAAVLRLGSAALAARSALRVSFRTGETSAKLEIGDAPALKAEPDE
ncbi:MAG: hypothetical protein Q8P41_18360 [Pseudomonadota bacterium]|nr:hypothetical protein [Pseudomonadota bacterium]